MLHFTALLSFSFFYFVSSKFHCYFVGSEFHQVSERLRFKKIGFGAIIFDFHYTPRQESSLISMGNCLQASETDDVDLLHSDNESVSVAARSAVSSTGGSVVHRSRSQSSETDINSRPARSSRRQNRNGNGDSSESHRRRSSDGAVRQRSLAMPPPSYEVSSLVIVWVTVRGILSGRFCKCAGANSQELCSLCYHASGQPAHSSFPD